MWFVAIFVVLGGGEACTLEERISVVEEQTGVSIYIFKWCVNLNPHNLQLLLNSYISVENPE